MEKNLKYERYRRQILLKEFGEDAQERLLRAKILVIGAGGLGCPALQYLAAAGVGYIGIVDFDVVELSNLQRQILFTTDDIGKPKSETAASKLRALNQGIQMKTYRIKLDNLNALAIISEYDLVIDGSDNFVTRYLLNDACVLLDKPLIYGAVFRFEGQVGVFNLWDEKAKLKTNYRDLFPSAPNPGSTQSCNDVGVIGFLPGIIGTMQAGEAIKIITGIGKPLANKIISYNALNNSFYEFNITPSDKKGINIPQNKKEFVDYNYEWFCNSTIQEEVSLEEFNSMMTECKIEIIDVREKDEMPLVNEFVTKNAPLSQLEKDNTNFHTGNKIVLFCNTGVRSLKALKLIKAKLPDLDICSLRGGIKAWKNHRYLLENDREKT